MIPPNIDYEAMLRSLNEWGVRDYKIESICALSEGYVAQLKCGNIGQMTYQRAARLYNFWCEQALTNGVPPEEIPSYQIQRNESLWRAVVPPRPLRIRVLAETTT